MQHHHVHPYYWCWFMYIRTWEIVLNGFWVDDPCPLFRRELLRKKRERDRRPAVTRRTRLHVTLRLSKTTCFISPNDTGVSVAFHVFKIACTVWGPRRSFKTFRRLQNTSVTVTRRIKHTMSLADATEGVGMEVDQGLTGVTTPGILAAYTTALLLFPASYQVGEFFAQMHLPTISGYLVTGVSNCVHPIFRYLR